MICPGKHRQPSTHPVKTWGTSVLPASGFSPIEKSYLPQNHTPKPRRLSCGTGFWCLSSAKSVSYPSTRQRMRCSADGIHLWEKPCPNRTIPFLSGWAALFLRWNTSQRKYNCFRPASSSLLPYQRAGHTNRATRRTRQSAPKFSSFFQGLQVNISTNLRLNQVVYFNLALTY